MGTETEANEICMQPTRTWLISLANLSLWCHTVIKDKVALLIAVQLGQHISCCHVTQSQMFAPNSQLVRGDRNIGKASIAAVWKLHLGSWQPEQSHYFAMT